MALAIQRGVRSGQRTQVSVLRNADHADPGAAAHQALLAALLDTPRPDDHQQPR